MNAKTTGKAGQIAFAIFLLGAVGAFTTPPLDLYFLVWPALCAYSLLIFRMPESTHQSRWRRVLSGMKGGIAFGFGINFVALRFIVPTVTRFTSIPFPVAVIGLALVALEQSVGWGFGAAVSRELAKRGVPRFLAFAAGVYIAMFFPSLFPWTAGAGLAPWPVFLQLADVIGERGVTFLCALIGGLFASGVDAIISREKKRAFIYFALGAGLLGLTAAEGALRMRQIESARASAPHARIALLQPGINALARWDEKLAPEHLLKLNGLTANAESRNAELTVWPESAYPYPLLHSTTRAPPGNVAILGVGVHGPVLFGSFTRTVRVDGGQNGYNSASIVFGDGELTKPYDKRDLLWFGETVPFADQIPWLRETFSRGTGLVPGDDVVRLDAGKIHAGVLICYEDTLIESGRDTMKVSPNVLINITNDAWFYGTSEGELHLRLSVLRAIELRRDIARAVNLGPTSLVDAAGVVRVRYSEGLPAAVPVDVALLELSPTFFARFGHWPITLLIAAACGLAMRRARREKTA